MSDDNAFSEAAVDQIIRLNDWMADNEPYIYWGGEGDDTATSILRVIEKYRTRVDELESQLSAPPVITAKSETVQFPCDSCGLQPHTIFTMGMVDVCQCTRCNKIAAVV